MAKPKFDYNGSEFYEELFALALQGMTDAEIADGLSEKFGRTLTPEVFCRMKNGKYEGWNGKQNKVFGDHISQVLARARRKVNSIVRGAYLKAALGWKKLKNKAITKRKVQLPDGTFSDEDIVQTTDTENELPPNMQALSTWLYHHDDDWRKIERKEEEADNVPADIRHGISIDEWIKRETNDKDA
jgi:hypothetical protein